MSATQHALQFAFATVAVHTHCQLEYRPGWLLSVQIHALSFSLWLAQRNCQEEIKWHAVWIEMPYATTHMVVLSYFQFPNKEGLQKTRTAYNINSMYISSFDFEWVFIFIFLITQVPKINILYISYKLKLYRIYKTGSLIYLYKSEFNQGLAITFTSVMSHVCSAPYN